MKTLEDAPLEAKERDAIAKAVNLLQVKFPVKDVILFGSKARGDDDEYSAY